MIATLTSTKLLEQQEPETLVLILQSRRRQQSVDINGGSVQPQEKREKKDGGCEECGGGLVEKLRLGTVVCEECGLVNQSRILVECGKGCYIEDEPVRLNVVKDSETQRILSKYAKMSSSGEDRGLKAKRFIAEGCSRLNLPQDAQSYAVKQYELFNSKCTYGTTKAKVGFIIAYTCRLLKFNKRTSEICLALDLKKSVLIKSYS